jgi:hypothetical protein
MKKRSEKAAARTAISLAATESVEVIPSATNRVPMAFGNSATTFQAKA